MRYEVTKAPGSNSRSRSFDKYSGRWIDNLSPNGKYHTRSTQSGLNSHKRYLGVSESLRVSYREGKDYIKISVGLI